MMNVQKPKLSKKNLSKQKINAAFHQHLSDEEALYGQAFEKDILEYGIFRRLEIRDCEFLGTFFDHLELPDGYLLDVLFKECDLSNAKFNHTLFRRVTFQSCKLSGTDFSDAMFDHVLFENCRMNYTNLSHMKIKAAYFKDDDLSDSSLMENDLKKVGFDHCNLTRAELLHSSLYQKDLSNCDIEGITLSFDDLKGAIVSHEQALALSLLLGIHIKEN